MSTVNTLYKYVLGNVDLLYHIINYMDHDAVICSCTRKYELCKFVTEKNEQYKVKSNSHIGYKNKHTCNAIRLLLRLRNPYIYNTIMELPYRTPHMEELHIQRARSETSCKHCPDDYLGVLIAVKHNANALQDANDKFKKNKDIVIAACKPSPIYNLGDIHHGQYINIWHRNYNNNKNAHKVETTLNICHKSMLTDDNVLECAIKYNASIVMQLAPFQIQKKYATEILYSDCRSYKFFPPELKNNKEITYYALSLWGYNLKYVPNDLRKDVDLVRTAVVNTGYALQYAGKFRSDRDIVILAISSFGEALEFASPELRGDINVVNIALRNNGDSLEYASDSIKDDYESVTYAIKAYGSIINASHRLRKDNDLVMLALSYGSSFASISKELQSNARIALYAVRTDGWSLRFMNEYFKTDIAIVMAAIGNNPQSIQFANIKLRKMKHILLYAVKKDGLTLQYASDELKSDYDIIKEAILQNHDAFIFASDTCKNNYTFVKQMLSLNGLILYHVPDWLRDNYSLVLTAVSNEGLSIKYAGLNTRDSVKITKTAVKNNGLSLLYVNENFKRDEDIVTLAINQNGYAIQYASCILRDSKKLSILAVMTTPDAFKFIPSRYIAHIPFIRRIYNESIKFWNNHI